VGPELHGTTFFGPERLEYSLTLSNGRSPISNVDFDNNKAVGGRLALATSRFGELKAGFSFYLGKYTDEKQTIDTKTAVESPTLPRMVNTITNQFDEVGLSGDLRWDWRWLGLRNEVAWSRIKYNDLYRPSAPVSNVLSFALSNSTLPFANHQMFSFFGLVFVQLPWINLRPYVGVGYFDVNDNVSWDDLVFFNAGLNYRPNARVVLKAEFGQYLFPNAGHYTVNTDYQASLSRKISMFLTQIAISF
jgi:hypothetical protein